MKKKKKEKRKKDVHLPKIAWHKSWKKKIYFLLSWSLETCPENISIATIEDRSSQVIDP